MTPATAVPMRDRPPLRSWAGALAGFALLVTGQGATLSLIDAPRYAVYQHFLPWAAILSVHSTASWLLGLQVIVVATCLWRLRSTTLGTWARSLPPVPSLVVITGAGFSLAVPTESVGRFTGEVVFAAGTAAVSAANVWLVVKLLPPGVLDRARIWLDRYLTLAPGEQRLRRLDRPLPWLIALWIVGVTAFTSYVVVERVPHIDDSISYLFQAKYHAVGQLFLPVPPDPASFQVDEVNIDADKWYGYGAPGWPLVLAIGVLAGAPWLVNPFLAGAMILAAHALIRRRSDRGTANSTILLLAASPWLIFMSAEFMPHPLTACLIIAGALAFDRAGDRTANWIFWALASGLAGGLLALTRPIEAVFATVAVATTMVIDRAVRRMAPVAILAGAVALSVAALTFPFNKALTGRATYTPQMSWTDRRWGPGVDRFGFGANIGIPGWRNIDPLPGHGPADVVLNLNKNAFMANIELFGWAAGSLLFVWIAFAIGGWRTGDGFMLALMATFVTGYSAWWFSGGPDLGPRYWYPLIVPMAAVSIRGAQMLSNRFATSGVGMRVGAFIVVASVSATATMLPWRAATKHYRYRDIGGGVRALAQAHGFETGCLVFVRSHARSDYQNAFNLNPKTLTGRQTIYAQDSGPAARARVVAAFPDRPVWLIGRNSSASRPGTFEVIVGPLAPGTVPP